MGILKDYNKGSMNKLRSLKYSDFGGKEPYIQKSEGFSYNAINSRTTDVERFAKLLTSKPGLKFQGNQALLQQVDQLKELRKSGKSKDGKFSFKGLLKGIAKQAVKTITNNVTTTASIVAQVPVNGTGTHFIRGLAPSGYLLSGAGPTTGLGSFLRDVGIGGGVNGAKSALNGDVIPTNVDSVLEGSESETLLSRQQQTGANALQQTAQSALNKFSNFSPNIGSAATSIFKSNASKLNIPFLSNKTGDNNYKEYLGQEILSGKEASTTVGPQSISTQVAKDRKILERKFDSSEYPNLLSQQESRSKSKNYLDSEVNIQRKYKLGDQGNPNSTYEGIDQLNVLAEQTANILESDIKDIIPFQFEVIEPNMSQPRFLYFRAFLDSLSDNYSGDWGGTKYIGRAEEFYTYQGFKRGVSFSFKIAAFSKSELIPLYKKLNFLVGTTAPTYASNGEFMKGTFVGVTIGDYITNQEGIITNVGLNWNKSYQWETDTQTGKKGPMLPHVLEVTVDFTPIHAFNVKSNVDLQDELYIGGETRLSNEVVTGVDSPIESRGITPLPSILPTATLPNLGSLLQRRQSTPQGTVEVGQGAFGGPFDQGDFQDLGG